MRYAVKTSKSRPVSIIKPDGVETEGYDAIHASSQPPYGPYIKKHKARVWGYPNTALNNVRIIDPKTDAVLQEIEQHIAKLKLKHQQILDDSFLTFRPATIADFPASIIQKGLSAEEARGRLPKGREAEKAKQQGERLAGLMHKINKIIY